MKTRLTVTLDERDIHNLSLRARRYGFGNASGLLRALCQHIAKAQTSATIAPDISGEVQDMFGRASEWEASSDNVSNTLRIKERR